MNEYNQLKSLKGDGVEPTSFAVRMPDHLEIELTSPEAAGLLRALAKRHGEALAAAALKFERLFLLRAPWAPGLRYAGGFVTAGPSGTFPGRKARLSVGGGGAFIEDALAGCIGEAIERLSQFPPANADWTAMPIAAASGRTLPGIYDRAAILCDRLRLDSSATVNWTAARVASTGEPCLVPADWCFRATAGRPFHVPGAALSTGVAAGQTAEAATLRAILELIERDAVGLWWLGGRRARTLSLESQGCCEAHDLLAALRLDNRDRASWLLDLTTDVGVPVIAAVSARADGTGCVFGFAARLNVADAVRAALFEMCQMELGLNIAEANEELGGPDALSDVDRGHLARARQIDTTTCALLHPVGAVVAPQSAASDGDAASLRTLVCDLAAKGIDIAVVDLTRSEFAIPVIAAIAPELQLMPSELETRRLCKARAAARGGTSFANALSLF